MTVATFTVIAVGVVLLAWGIGFELKVDALERALRRGGWTTPKHFRLARRRAALWFIPSRLYYAREVAMERAKRGPKDGE